MQFTWLGAAVGFAAGYLSGQFGIGGGLVTTPAIRMLLGGSAMIAVGTSLPVIIPTALTGAVAYRRAGLIDGRTGLAIGLVGALFSVLGAWGTVLVGGETIMFLTAALIAWMAIDMGIMAFRPERDQSKLATEQARTRSWVWVGVLGAITGLYSGFLGLGGGFVVVPALMRYFGFDAKRAIGTSLLVVLMLAVPGTITHYLLGHVDLGMAISISVGVVPGSLIGAKVTELSKERTVRVGFALMLLVVGALLALGELGVI